MSDEEQRARIAGLIAEHGWFCQLVFTAADDDTDAPGFAYTIGLRDSFGHPDLLVSGMSDDDGYATLDVVVDLVRGGARFAHGDTSEDVLDGGPVLFVTVADAARREYLAWADWYYEREPFAALQVVYPDRRGRWPWEEGSRAARQEVLGEVPR